MPNLVESTESKLLLFARPSRLLIMTAGSLAFVVAGLWLGLTHEEPAANVTGWAGVVFFGACGVYIARRLFSRTPMLVVDRDGIVDRASGAAVGRIRWDEIRDVAISRVGAQKFLGIHVRDPDALRARLPFGRRLMARLNCMLGLPPVNLPQSALPIPVEELAENLLRALAARAPVTRPDD